jgi:cell division protein FtsB
MTRCYDPRRMSSAPFRTRPPVRLVAQRAVKGVSWTVLFAVLAASAAGLAGLAWHAPGSAARAELTYQGDAALGARLDAAAAELQIIAADVEKLADEAKTALEEVASVDPARLQASLQRGGALADAIDARARALRTSLVDLPGGEPDAPLLYSNQSLVRRAAILAAIDASLGLAAHWRTVGLRASETANLTGLITQHDGIVLDATELGRNSRFKNAVTTLDEALLVIVTIEELRGRLIATTEETVLDEWIDRTRTWDLALRNLYDALRKSKGKVTLEVQSARREEQLAYDNLPPDRRTILVIISEVTRGGLTLAVIAIEDAHGRLDEALLAVADASGSAAPAPT